MDTHAHIFERGLKVAELPRYIPDYDATLAEYLSLLDAYAIPRAVLIQPSFLGLDNGYLLAAVRRVPARLRGIVVVDPRITPAELAAMARQGAVGIRLNLIGQAAPKLEADPWPVLLSTLRALEWLVEVQCEARTLPLVIPTLLGAGLNVVIDHFGRPDPDSGLADPGFRYLLSLAATRQVWVKLSGAYRNGWTGPHAAVADAAAKILLREFGPTRLLWGSDWPHTQFERHTNYGNARAELDRWIADPADRTTVFTITPRQLYRFYD